MKLKTQKIAHITLLSCFIFLAFFASAQQEGFLKHTATLQAHYFFDDHWTFAPEYAQRLNDKISIFGAVDFVSPKFSKENPERNLFHVAGYTAGMRYMLIEKERWAFFIPLNFHYGTTQTEQPFQTNFTAPGGFLDITTGNGILMNLDGFSMLTSMNIGWHQALDATKPSSPVAVQLFFGVGREF